MTCMWAFNFSLTFLQFVSLWFLIINLVYGVEEYIFIDDNIYLEVMEPESLKYSFKVRLATQFGKPFKRQLTNIGLVVCDPYHCCNSPLNTLELQNNVALTERGGCSFLTKCIQAQNAGALAVVVADNDPSNDAQYIDMMDDNTKRNCSIPAVFMLGKDAYMIRRGIQAHRLSRAIITVPVNITSLPNQEKRPPPWVVCYPLDFLKQSTAQNGKDLLAKFRRPDLSNDSGYSDTEFVGTEGHGVGCVGDLCFPETTWSIAEEGDNAETSSTTTETRNYRNDTSRHGASEVNDKSAKQRSRSSSIINNLVTSGSQIVSDYLSLLPLFQSANTQPLPVPATKKFDNQDIVDLLKNLAGCSLANQLTQQSAHDKCTLDLAQAAYNLQSFYQQPSALSAHPSGDSLESLERLARMYRTRASLAQPTYTWRGTLPRRHHLNPTYSTKVFLGGVPWDISEIGLREAFADYGVLQVQVPRREVAARGFGYVYVIFDSDLNVRRLLKSCSYNVLTGEFFFKVSSRRIRQKEVQVIPWIVEESNFVRMPSGLHTRHDSSKTVFVGALHGMMRAEDLAIIMDDLFGSVVFAGIDTDKYKYPIGSGRVSFYSESSYHKAVQAGFIEVKTPHFTKKIQVDPYLQDAICSHCRKSAGIVFCRNAMCFRYFCRACWAFFHRLPWTNQHEPLMRNRSSYL